MIRSLFVPVLILLFAGGASAAEFDVDSLASADPDVRAAARSEFAARGREALSELEAGLESENPLVASACADVLGDLGLRAARDELHAAARDGQAPALVLRAVCRALGAVGDDRDVALLAKLAPSVPEAALALARIGAAEAIGPLMAVAEREGATPEVAYAVAALGELRAVDWLIAGLEAGGRDPIVSLHFLRKLSGESLGRDPMAWRVWLRRERLARSIGDPDWDASEAALARIRELEPMTPEYETTVSDLLAIATDRDAERFARTKAILALGLVGGPTVAPVLVDVLETDGDPQVRLYAAEALGRLAVPATAVDLAWYLIFDEEPFRKLSLRAENTRYYTIDSEVCKSLVKMGVAGGLDTMIRQLGEEHRIRVYHEALKLLREVSGKEFGYHQDGPLEDRLAAAARWREWFDENRSSLVLPGRRVTNDPAFRLRVREFVDRLNHFKFLYMSRARETLTLLGETALPELQAGLERPEMHIRIHCAEILGRIHSKRSRGALAALLSDPKYEVRAAGVAALGEIGPGDAVEYVVEALGDESADVRIEAAHALARADFDRAVPALRNALEREGVSDAFRREAWFALSAHGYADAIDSLAGMLDHPDVAFRAEVASRLKNLTGRDPGVEPEGIAKWRSWWEVSRKDDTEVRPAGDGR